MIEESIRQGWSIDSARWYFSFKGDNLTATEMNLQALDGGGEFRESRSRPSSDHRKYWEAFY